MGLVRRNTILRLQITSLAIKSRCGYL